MSAAAAYGLIAWALLVGAGAAFLAQAWRLPLAAGVAGLALAPLLAGESLAMVLHGALAAPSFTLLLLVLRRLVFPARESWLEMQGAVLLLAFGLVYYPLALGLGPFDPYALGYRPQELLPFLLPLAGWLAWRRQQAWLLILAFDLMAYAAGFFGNLWDACLDPLLVLLAAVTLVSRRRPGRSGA